MLIILYRVYTDVTFNKRVNEESVDVENVLLLSTKSEVPNCRSLNALQWHILYK